MSFIPAEYRSNLTDWFPGSVNPERTGTYQTSDKCGESWFNFYDKKLNVWYWGSGDLSLALADVYHRPASVMNFYDRQCHVQRWRGLSKNLAVAA